MAKCLTVPAYSNTTEKCKLCLPEKLCTLMYPIPYVPLRNYVPLCTSSLMYPNREEILKKRPEIMSRSPHQRKYSLSNYDSKD